MSINNVKQLIHIATLSSLPPRDIFASHLLAAYLYLLSVQLCGLMVFSLYQPRSMCYVIVSDSNLQVSDTLVS